MNEPEIKKQKILIIEDELTLINALQEKLSREGFNALTAKDGLEGLKTALREHPDLILLDLVMPKMDGMTMLGKLREDEWGKNAKVIVLSNITDSTKVAEVMKNNTFEYLVKTDVKIEDIVLKVKQKLGIS